MISTLDAKQFLEMIIAGKYNLEKHVDEVNTLNKLPIPDCDTGTNMIRTMMSTATYAGYDFADGKLTLGELSLRVSLRMGISAKGKSGVFLHKFFDGFVEPLENQQLLTSQHLKYSFQNAQANLIFLHQSHANCIPEIMQLMEKMVDAAERLSGKDNLSGMMYRMTTDAQECVRENEITDAGCIGLLYVIEGMWMYLHSKSIMILR